MNRLNDSKSNDRDDTFYKKHYGPNVIVSRLGRINIVHMDNPTPEMVQSRIEEITREEITGEAWDDDCPCCRMMKDKPHDVVYPAKMEGDLE